MSPAPVSLTLDSLPLTLDSPSLTLDSLSLALDSPSLTFDTIFETKLTNIEAQLTTDRLSLKRATHYLRSLDDLRLRLLPLDVEHGLLLVVGNAQPVLQGGAVQWGPAMRRQVERRRRAVAVTHEGGDIMVSRKIEHYYL